MYYLYVLKSFQNDKYYVGSTQDIDKRLKEHNSGKSKSTKGSIPWQIIYSEGYPTRTEARKRELYLKKRKSRKYIDSLINDSLPNIP